jgi:DNA replication and repair protein RecF
LFQEGAGERRRFLDRMVLALDPAHARRSSAYESAMRDRNRLLTEWPRVDVAWLDALEAGMADHGAAIAAARRGLLTTLQPVLDAAADGPFARPSLALIEGDGAEGAADASALAAALKSSRARDAAAGRTLIGPHRVDLSVTHAAKGQEAAHCSTGEQKALLLSLILGQAELVADRRGMAPVLLLDEVAAHLDAARRDALFARLAGLGGQIWMTGTDKDAFAGAFARGAQGVEIG